MLNYKGCCDCGYESVKIYTNLVEASNMEGEICPDCGEDLNIICLDPYEDEDDEE